MKQLRRSPNYLWWGWALLSLRRASRALVVSCGIHVARYTVQSGGGFAKQGEYVVVVCVEWRRISTVK